MASSPPFVHSFLLISAVALLISPAASQPCKSQTFSKTTPKFTTCTDLPTLKAQIHWAYYPSAKPNPTLTIGYLAPPPKPDGWVAWALNPTGLGMLGAQALVAFKDANGSAVVKTYNISSYAAIAESRISYEVLSKEAEFSDGLMKIIAKLELPPGRTVLNQVWQVGSSVKDGVPVRHDFSPQNLGSKATLQLGGKAAASSKGAPTPAPSTAPARGSDLGGSWRIYGSGVGQFGALSLPVVLLGVLSGF